MKLELKKFVEYFRNKNPFYDISKSFVCNGFGQKSGGYIALARKNRISIDMENAEPNQQWHLLTAYYNELTDDQKRTKNYRYLKCPELLLWIAEAAGIDSALVDKAANEAREIINNGTNGYSRIKAASKIKTIITWDMIEEKIQN